MAKYLVKTPIRMNADANTSGPTHDAGDTIELSDKDAAAMGDDVVTRLNDKGTKEAK